MLNGLFFAVTLAFYSAIVFGIWKIFQIGRDVAEIKAVLREMRRGETIEGN